MRRLRCREVQSHTIICYLFCGLFIIYLWGYSRISLGLVNNLVKEHPDIPIYKKKFGSGIIILPNLSPKCFRRRIKVGEKSDFCVYIFYSPVDRCMFPAEGWVIYILSACSAIQEAGNIYFYAICPDTIYYPTFLVECDRTIQERCHRRVGCMICMYTDYTDYKLQITSWPCYISVHV